MTETQTETETKSSRNPRIKRDYLDIDKAGNISTPEDAINPRLIRFYEPDMEERGDNFDIDLREFPKLILAFSTCHGIAQVAGDQFNKRAVEAEDGSTVPWAWENVKRYLSERADRFKDGKWGMSDPGDGAGKSALWKLAFHNNMDRYLAGNDEEAITFYSGLMGLDAATFANRVNRVNWLNETSDENKAAIRDSQDVDTEKKRMAAEKAAPPAPSSFDFRS